MAWNQPGGGKDKNQDPWRGKNDQQGPPDLDEFFRNLQSKLNGLFGGGGGNGGGKNGRQGQGEGGVAALVLIAVVLLVGFWAFQGIYRVEQAEQAVVLKFGKFDRVVGAGLHWNPPILYQVYKENTEQVNSLTHRATILTEDKNIVDVEIEVQYRIADPAKYFLEIRDPRGSLRQAAESALRHVVGSSIMDKVLTEGRDLIAQEVKQRSQDYLDVYKSGLLITKVNIEDAHPPDAVKDAFDDVIKAKEDEERFKNEAEAYANGVLPEAEGRAQREIEQANAYKEEVTAKARGEAARFTKLLEEYERAPEVTRKRIYIEAMESVLSSSSKVLMSGEPGNNLVYLPLDQIMKSSSASLPQTIVNDSPKAASTSSLRDSTSNTPRNRPLRESNHRREGR